MSARTKGSIALPSTLIRIEAPDALSAFVLLQRLPALQVENVPVEGGWEVRIDPGEEGPELLPRVLGIVQQWLVDERFAETRVHFGDRVETIRP